MGNLRVHTGAIGCIGLLSSIAYLQNQLTALQACLPRWWGEGQLTDDPIVWFNDSGLWSDGHQLAPLPSSKLETLLREAPRVLNTVLAMVEDREPA